MSNVNLMSQFFPDLLGFSVSLLLQNKNKKPKDKQKSQKTLKCDIFESKHQPLIKQSV